MVILSGGEHRFKKVITPTDHVQYQAFLDFCFDVTRPNMHFPFDKREIEFFLVDDGENLQISRKEVDRFIEVSNEYLDRVNSVSPLRRSNQMKK